MSVALKAIVLACSLSGQPPHGCGYLEVPGTFSTVEQCSQVALNNRDWLVHGLADALGGNVAATMACGEPDKLDAWLKAIGVPLH